MFNLTILSGVPEKMYKIYTIDQVKWQVMIIYYIEIKIVGFCCQKWQPEDFLTGCLLFCYNLIAN